MCAQQNPSSYTFFAQYSKEQSDSQSKQKPKPSIFPLFFQPSSVISFVIFPTPQKNMAVTDPLYLTPSEESVLKLTALIMSSKGAIFALNPSGGQLLAYSTKGKYVLIMKHSVLANPGGIAIHSDDTLFYSDKTDNIVRRITTSGITPSGTLSLRSSEAHYLIHILFSHYTSFFFLTHHTSFFLTDLLFSDRYIRVRWR